MKREELNYLLRSLIPHPVKEGTVKQDGGIYKLGDPTLITGNFLVKR